MSPVYATRITCPNCQNQFQTLVEQIIDVRVDPNAKVRLLNGLINVASCPQCGMGGLLNLPFLYHDPENELALVYMPMEAGQDNVERQKAIGQLTQQTMDNLPPEERKGYLLQPQEFFSLENLIKKVLEVDGITSEMIEAREEKANFLRDMVEVATDEEALETLIRDNEERIDEDLLQMVMANRRMVEAMEEQKEALEILDTLYDKLIEITAAGQNLSKRQSALNALRENPSQEKLLELLIQSSDEKTRETLIVIGLPLVDYRFFRSLTNRIESTTEEEERAYLEELRREVLDIREQVERQTQEFYEQRVNFLQDLLASDDPMWLARYRYREVDQAFLEVLRGMLENVQQQGNQEILEKLKKIWDIAADILQEQQPPALLLLNRLMSVEEDEEIDELLMENEDLLSTDLLEYAETVEQNLREDEQTEMADRLVHVMAKIREHIQE